MIYLVHSEQESAMSKSKMPASNRSGRSTKIVPGGGSKAMRRKSFRPKENSDVLVSAVISSYLLTHLHHVLQSAEYYSLKEGRTSQASNFAQLRKVLCMDARSMKDASASGMKEGVIENWQDENFGSKVA